MDQDKVWIVLDPSADSNIFILCTLHTTNSTHPYYEPWISAHTVIASIHMYMHILKCLMYTCTCTNR